MPVRLEGGPVTIMLHKPAGYVTTMSDPQGRPTLVLRLTAPPVEGAANTALIAFVAKSLRLPKSAIAIASGETSRTKSLRISAPDAEARLRGWLAEFLD